MMKSHLINELLLNIEISSVMFKDLGIDGKVVNEKCIEISKFINDISMILNNGKDDINALNIEISIIMAILFNRLEEMDNFHKNVSNMVGVSKDIIENENRNSIMELVSRYNKKN